MSCMQAYLIKPCIDILHIYWLKGFLKGNIDYTAFPWYTHCILNLCLIGPCSFFVTALSEPKYELGWIHMAFSLSHSIPFALVPTTNRLIPCSPFKFLGGSGSPSSSHSQWAMSWVTGLHVDQYHLWSSGCGQRARVLGINHGHMWLPHQ